MTPTFFFSLFIVLSVSFRLVRLVMAIHKARAGGRGQTAARPMFWIMTVSYVMYVSLCIREGWQGQDVFEPWVACLGVIVFVSALTLREKAMKDLGRYFSPDIEIRNRHQVVRQGLYAYIRHPLLACMALEIVGLGLVFNATQTLLIVGLGFYFPLIAVRKTLEEQTLVRSLGESYRHYQKEVGAFWPRRLHE